MTKEFNNLKEIQKYYNEEIDTYVFKEKGQYIDLVVFNFDLNIKSNIIAYDIIARDISVGNIIARGISACDISAWNIRACDINARNITAYDIDVWDINANDIKADNISYYAVCFAYNNIKCKSIKGRKENAKHFVLDGKLEIEE